MFGKTLSHWAKDLMGLIKYVNFFRLIPTIYILLTAPGHFFKSIPAILGGKKTYYISPLQFLLNLVVLQIAILHFFPTEGNPNEEILRNQYFLITLNIGFAVLSPVTMAIACLLILLLWQARNRGILSKLVPEDLLNTDALTIPLRPSTYRVLDWQRFLWSLPYYYLYFYFAVLVVFGCFALAIALLEGPGHSYGVPSGLINLLFAVVALITALVGYWALVRPYVFLLVYSARSMTPIMLRAVDYSRKSLIYREVQIERSDLKSLEKVRFKGSEFVENDEKQACQYCGGVRRHKFGCPCG
jgi:hypothetical protein